MKATSLVVVTGLVLGVSGASMAQTDTPTPQGPAGAAGTSDRTPGQKTEIPTGQRYGVPLDEESGSGSAAGSAAAGEAGGTGGSASEAMPQGPAGAEGTSDRTPGQKTEIPTGQQYGVPLDKESGASSGGEAGSAGTGAASGATGSEDEAMPKGPAGAEGTSDRTPGQETEIPDTQRYGEPGADSSGSSSSDSD